MAMAGFLMLCVIALLLLGRGRNIWRLVSNNYIE